MTYLSWSVSYRKAFANTQLLYKTVCLHGWAQHFLFSKPPIDLSTDPDWSLHRHCTHSSQHYNCQVSIKRIQIRKSWNVRGLWFRVLRKRQLIGPSKILLFSNSPSGFKKNSQERWSAVKQNDSSLPSLDTMFTIFLSLAISLPTWPTFLSLSPFNLTS